MKPFAYIIIFLFLISCGKKGDPTLKAFEPPLPVSNITAIHQKEKIILKWFYPSQQRQKIKGFHILRAEQNRDDFKKIGIIENNISQYVDTDFEINHEYLYKIRVVSLKDMVTDSDIIRVKPLPAPPPPTGIIFSIGNDSVQIKWNKMNNYKYNIYKSYEKGKFQGIPLNSVPINENFFNDKIEKERTVYYAVSSLYDTEIKDEGNISDEIEIKPEDYIPSRPVNLQYVLSENGVYLLWQENPETWIRGYNIYCKEKDEDRFSLIGTSITPAFIDKRPLKDKRFYYVVAKGPVKESNPSEIIEIIPLER